MKNVIIKSSNMRHAHILICNIVILIIYDIAGSDGVQAECPVSAATVCMMVARPEVVSRFGGLVSRLEKKPQCKGRSLELFLTYPMHQVGPYINTIRDVNEILWEFSQCSETSM